MLLEPFDFLDLEHSDSVTLSITSYLLDEAVIHPVHPSPRQISIYMAQNGLTAPPALGMPIGIKIPVLRVFGTRIDKPSSQTYWDISSKRLIADLTPVLARVRGTPTQFTLTANGYKPSKRYSIET